MDLFKNIEKMLKDMGFNISFDTDCTCNDNCKCSSDDSCRCQSGKSMIYGYEYSIDSDGKPTFREYGNVPSPITGKALGQEKRFDIEVIMNEDGTGKIIAEAPGFEKEDFNISLNRTNQPVVKITAHRGNRDFNEEVSVFSNIDPTSLKAKYINGVLEITFSNDKPQIQKIDVE